MAKNGNASAIMKELLLNLLKYANPILNRVLGFKATGSRLCMWIWALSNDSAYSSLFVNQTSRHSRAHVKPVCFWQPMWEVVCLWAVPRCNLWTYTPTTPVYHLLTWQLEFTDLDSVLTLGRLRSYEWWIDDELHHYMISQHEVSKVGGQPVNHINNSFNHQRLRLM